MRGARSFNRNAKSYQRDKPKRRATGRTFLIITEGEKTEPHYFFALRDQLQLKSADVEIIHPKGTDPMSLTEKAKALRETRKKAAINGFLVEYDEVWVVFDLETANHPHRKKAEQVQSSKEFSGIDFAFSDPIFHKNSPKCDEVCKPWTATVMEPPREGCGMKDASRLVKVNQNTVWDHAAIDAGNRLSLTIVPRKHNGMQCRKGWMKSKGARADGQAY